MQSNALQDPGYLNVGPRETDNTGVWPMIDQIAARGGKCRQCVRESMI